MRCRAMAWKIIEAVAGMLIVLGTVIDVFGTVVVPGRVRIGLRIPSLIKWWLLPGWRGLSRHVGRKERGTVTSTFAALLLFFVFLSWVALLLIGLGLLMHSLRTSFTPPLRGFTDALFQTGSAMMTLGLNGPAATGWARAVVVLAGVAGLQVVTLTLTYIVQLQMALQQRDPLVLRLECRAGTPPSAATVLATHKQLGLERDMGRVFESWEEWTAVLRQTHGAHPVLLYFRSGEPHDDWVTALGAVMDAAALVLAAIPDGPKGNAELLWRNGLKTVRQVCGLLGLKGECGTGGADDDARDALKRLREAGYEVLPDAEAIPEILRRRRDYGAMIALLAAHFGVEAPRLVGPPVG